MPADPLVSVLMTVYNREPCLREAVESVLQSTYGDFELVIADDHSSDNSLAIARELEKLDPRIRVFSNDQNLGQFRNRNVAASRARGRYLKYLDSDDIIYPHGLAVMVDALERFPSAGFALQNTLAEDQQPYPYLVEAGKSVAWHFLKKPFLVSGPSGVIFREDAFRGVSGFREPFYTGSDTEILLRLACKHDLVLFPPGLIWWRKHDGQAFLKGQRDFDYYLHDYRHVRSVITTTFNPPVEKTRKQILAKLRNLQAGRILKLSRMGRFRVAYRLWREMVK
jgi:glycosyltransferase involved in cell wall biosynthesis